MWRLLRFAVLHYMRADDANDFTMENRIKARSNLIEYGAFIQRLVRAAFTM